jgi:hypothetical protein
MKSFVIRSFHQILTVLAASIIRAMMEATSTSETLVNIYQTSRRLNPEDIHPIIFDEDYKLWSHLQTRRSENLKSYQILSEPSTQVG